MKIGIGAIRNWVSQKRDEMAPTPPSWRANLAWIVGSLVTSWVLGAIFTSGFPWLWNFKLTVALNLPGIKNIPIPAFSGWLFTASSLIGSVFYLLPRYLVHNGSWSGYGKEIFWRVIGLWFGIPFATALGSSLFGLVKDRFPLLNDVNLSAKVQLGYAQEPMSIEPTFGALICFLIAVAWISKR